MNSLVAGLREIRSQPADLVTRLHAMDLPSVVAGASFILFLLNDFDHPLLEALLGCWLLVLVVDRSVICKWWFWASIALTTSYVLVRTWEDTGNHNYIITYWGWVLTCAFISRSEAARIILFNARFFLIFIFLVAVLQKYLSPSYLSGEMFEMKLLRSDGFHYFAITFGIDTATIDATKAQIELLRSAAADVEGNAVLIPSNDHVQNLTYWVTWYDFWIQVAIGVALLFRQRAIEYAAHIMMLFFIVTAYVWIPITGFGWSLTVMGLALSKDRFPNIHLAYYVCLFALVLYHLPWGQVFARIAGA